MGEKLGALALDSSYNIPAARTVIVTWTHIPSAESRTRRRIHLGNLALEALESWHLMGSLMGAEQGISCTAGGNSPIADNSTSIQTLLQGCQTIFMWQLSDVCVVISSLRLAGIPSNCSFGAGPSCGCKAVQPRTHVTQIMIDLCNQLISTCHRSTINSVTADESCGMSTWRCNIASGMGGTPGRAT